MLGWFSWDDCEQDLSQVPHEYQVTCPNCGGRVSAGKTSGHTCNEDTIEEHHVRRLNLEFRQVLHPRNCWEHDRDVAYDAVTQLWAWKPLEDWLATSDGQFAAFYARRDRP